MTMARQVGILLVMTVVGAFGLSTSAAAQTNDEIFPQFQWNFSTPGARANAMGRTFVGLADDGTAVVTNPAGLISLTKPQVYAEYKNTDIKVNRLAAIDSLTTLQPTTFSTDVNAISFFSVSTPIGNKIGVGFSYNQFLNYQETFHLSPRTVHDANNPSQLINFVTFGVDGDANFKGSSFGGSVAFAVTNQLRLGLTVSENHLSAQSEGTRFDTIFGPTFLKNGVVSNPNDITQSNIIVSQTSINDSNNAFGWAVGALLRPNEDFSVGFDYTKGPSFKINERFLFNPGRNVNNAVLGTNQPLTPLPGFGDPTALSINVPDHYGVGVAGRPIPRLLVAFDVIRVNYSSLAKNFVTTLDFTSALSPNQFSIDDATEAHLGGEYNIIAGPTPVFVRAGFFTNPNHTLKFNPGPNTAGNLNNYYNAVYNLLPRDTEKTGTFGGGVVFGPRFQLDLAYVWKKEFVASTAVRF